MEHDNINLRKKLGLPVNKDLVYLEGSAMLGFTGKKKVIDFEIVKEYNITRYWATLELTLEDNKKVRIHSAYFADMQSGIIKNKKDIER